MTSSPEPQVRQDIRQVLQDINDAWTRGRPENLAQFFHEDMVIVDSDFRVLAEGKEVCVKSYQDFCSQATVHDFKRLDSAIHVFGNTAVAAYRFEITYEMKGQTLRESGWDVFVLVGEEGKWKAAWRTLLPISGGNLLGFLMHRRIAIGRQRAVASQSRAGLARSFCAGF